MIHAMSLLMDSPPSRALYQRNYDECSGSNGSRCSSSKPLSRTFPWCFSRQHEFAGTEQSSTMVVPCENQDSAHCSTTHSKHVSSEKASALKRTPTQACCASTVVSTSSRRSSVPPPQEAVNSPS